MNVSFETDLEKEPNKLELYTLDKAIENLILLQQHLEDFLNREHDKNFCIECCMKHTYAISGLASECISGMCNTGETASIWYATKNFMQELKDKLPSLDEKTAIEYVSTIRMIRKKLMEILNMIKNKPCGCAITEKQ